MPDGIPAALEARVESLGAHPIKVDVSEFHKKGGGSVKCMIGDMGLVGGKEDLEGTGRRASPPGHRGEMPGSP